MRASRYNGLTATPSRRCTVCGEWLPHYCAAVITRTRQRYTGTRLVTITDRMPRDNLRITG